MAVVPPLVVPLVANTEALVQACHEMLDDGKGMCEHKGGAIISIKNCEIMAQAILDKGAFQSSTEMIGSLKSNPDVQKVITEAMADAWDEGHKTACVYVRGGGCAHSNPYREEL